MKKVHKDLWYDSKHDIRVRGDLVKRKGKKRATTADVLAVVQDVASRLGHVEKDIVGIKKDVVKINTRLNTIVTKNKLVE